MSTTTSVQPNPMANNPTAAQRRRWTRVAALGCLNDGRPAIIHHCRHECGMSQRNHDHVAPLCGDCHLLRHNNPKRFYAQVGTDKELHDETVRRLGEI